MMMWWFATGKFGSILIHLHKKSWSMTSLTLGQGDVVQVVAARGLCHHDLKINVLRLHYMVIAEYCINAVKAPKLMNTSDIGKEIQGVPSAHELELG